VKDGRVESDIFLQWVRRQPCAICEQQGAGARPGSEAHHFPPKGMGGARCRDDRTIPLCRRHHEEAQAYRISSEAQQKLVEQTRSRFLEGCSPEELRVFCNDLHRWKTRPMMVPI
jgi:hypothetical protein